MSGCHKQMSEQEQYTDLQDSISYRAYKSASYRAVKPLVDQVNNAGLPGAANLGRLSENDGHAILALLWMIAMKPDLAIAEANLTLAEKTTAIDQYRGRSALAVGMYQKDWRTLALATSTLARSALNDKALAQKLYYEQMSTYMAIGLLSMREQNVQGARGAFSALGALTGISWLSDAAEAIVLIQQGDYVGGLRRLKAASTDPGMPERERAHLAMIIASIEAEAGDVQGQFFVPKVFGKVLLQRIIETDRGPLRDLVARLEVLKTTYL